MPLLLIAATYINKLKSHMKKMKSVTTRRIMERSEGVTAALARIMKRVSRPNGSLQGSIRRFEGMGRSLAASRRPSRPLPDIPAGRSVSLAGSR